MSSEYEKKLISMRYQMQENQSYMQDYFKDLENWTDEVKKKEENLKKSQTQNDKDLPPIRYLATEKKRKKKKKTENKEDDKAKKAEKIKAYDYRKWDKFNVDAACEEVDKRVSSESEYTTDEEWEEEQRKQRANWEKERGNLFLQNNQIDEAINCYTRAIELDSNNAIFLANRALCLIKQEKYGAAEVDCTLAIDIDKSYVKAYLRRGTARFSLKHYDTALEDFKRVLEIEPTNKQAKYEVLKIEKLIESKTIVYPIDKPVDKRSKKPLKQIMIEEINDENSDRQQERLNEINSKVKLNEADQKMFNIEKKAVQEAVVETKVPEQKAKVDKIIKNLEDIQIKTNKTVVIPGVPLNGYQFRKDWQSLNNNVDDLTTYFKQIQPASYPKLFMNGLESDMLSKLLRVFKNFIIQDQQLDLYSYMKFLSDVKRFQTQFMFLSNDDTKIIKDLLEHVRKNSKIDASQMESLTKAYQQ